MGRDDVIRQLKANLSRLSEFRIKSLAIFGSVARDEAKPDSDVDMLVEFDGLATFDRYMELKLFLEDLLGRPVDLVTRKGVRPELAPYVEQEARRVA
ncbi:MAG: nucleotidyltransferase family protein [Candidatus Omnitrophica bacterium]|nr:nucleotidyltransferase family protein [Candidatus Omnitrophota bacterium]